MRYGNAIDLYVDGTRPVKVVDAEPYRTVVNLAAGLTDLWWGGDKTLEVGTIMNKIVAGSEVKIEGGGEIWVRRMPGNAGSFGMNEEFSDGDI